jgi:hypothetical protein
MTSGESETLTAPRRQPYVQVIYEPKYGARRPGSYDPKLGAAIKATGVDVTGLSNRLFVKLPPADSAPFGKVGGPLPRGA